MFRSWRFGACLLASSAFALSVVEPSCALFGPARAAADEPEIPASVRAQWKQWGALEQKGEFAKAIAIAPAVFEAGERVFASHPTRLNQLRYRYGRLCVEAGNYSEAEKQLALASEAFRGQGADGRGPLVDCLTWHGRVRMLQHESADAEQLLDEAVRLAEELGAREAPRLVRALCERSIVATEQSQWASAVELAERALAIVQVRLDSRPAHLAEAYHALGFAQERTGDIGLAETSQYKSLAALTAAKVAEDHPLVGRGHYRVASIRAAQNRPAEAEGRLRAARDIWQRTLGPEHLLMAHALNDLGNARGDQQDFEGARFFYEKSLSIKRSVLGPDNPDVAISLRNVGVTYAREKQFDRARELFEQALAIDRSAAKTDADARVIHGMGTLANSLVDLKRVAEAKAMLERAAELADDVLGPAHPDALRIQRSLLVSLLYSKLSDPWKEIRSRVEARLTVIEKRWGEDHPAYWQTLLMYLDMYNGPLIVEATWLESIVDKMEKQYGGDHPRYYEVLGMLASVSASDASLKFADRSERARHRYLTRILPSLPESQQYVELERTAGKREMYTWNKAAESGAPDEAIALGAEWLLNHKGLALDAMASSRRQLAGEENAPARRVAKELTGVRRELAGHISQAPAPDGLEEAVARLRALQAREQELQSALLASPTPDFSRQEWAELSAVRRAIPKDSILVEFVRSRVRPELFADDDRELPPRFVRWVIPAEGEGDVRLDVLESAEEIGAAIGGVYFGIGSSLRLAKQGIDPDRLQLEMQPLLTECASLLLQNMVEELQSGKKLIISPDAELWLVPWGCLQHIMEEGFLIERRDIRLLISGRQLLTRPLDPPSGPAVVFGNLDYGQRRAADVEAVQAFRPLTGSEREVELIAPHLEKLAGQAPLLFTGRNGVESKALALRSPPVLHFSTHGYAQLVPPRARIHPLLTCGLALSGANRRPAEGSLDDGVLTGLEILDMDLRSTRLVVLSACETGVGRTRSGEGIMSLRQAFHIAGARQVVASLWTVPDQETADLMVDFARLLAEGKEECAAICEAQRLSIARTKQKHGYPHPFYWAAFSLTGY